ncbi:MAG: hypothetical protein JJ892_09555 [Balneola sp.]|nr:hypothetical protein [Balneola sp.]MBO6649754.1 hypothetical protein [Balneola sp.]MBO6800511.1 hypothetical protein [Balneola sp.]
MEIKQGQTMKRIQQILPALLILLLTPSLGWAQSFDANRMNRDIKIMENILGEMFKTYSGNTTSERVFISESFTGSRNVRGTYLPGYGIIFNVQTGSSFVISQSSDSEGSSNSFYYSYSTGESSNDDVKVDEESVKDRIIEFLKDYASTIGQLKPTENVMVIYGSNSRHSFPALVYTSSNGKIDRKEREKLPVISGSVTKKDLDDYRSGKINESAFAGKVKTASTKDKEYLDLKVMGNIFETALKEQDDESFRLSGNVNYLMLDNFGAIFNLDASYRTNNRLFGRVSGITVTGAYIRTDSRDAPDAKEAEEKEAEFLANVNEAYSQLKNNIKEYLVDYGRTVNSVKPDQYILTTVNVRGRYKDIPERIDFQLKKAVLDQLDKGSISREEALKQVVVTEY